MAVIETFAVPTWLYRYRSLRRAGAENGGSADRSRLDRELTAIIDGYVWCDTFNRMNDPMEGFYRSSTGARARANYDELVEQIGAEKHGLGIASFSESWDNELMWAHYADGFRGICIVYKFAPLLEALPDTHALSRIAYGDRPHYLNLRASNDAQRARAILSTKSLKWSYEREWRLFAPARGQAPHGEGVIPTVYLGMRMTADDRQLVRRRLRGTGIAVKQTLIDGYALKCLSKKPRAKN